MPNQKTVLITGAGTGIGLSALMMLQKEGHAFIAAIETKEQAKNLPEGTEWIAGDVTNEAFRTLLAQTYAEKVDVFISNAGHGEAGPLIEQPEERIRKVFEVNVFGMVLLAQKFGQAMVKRGHGRLVFMSSMAGFYGFSNLGAYCATKHAVEAFAKTLRIELKPFGVDVATVEPGTILTGFNERMAASKWEWLTEGSLFKSCFTYWKKRDANLPKNSYHVDLAARTLAHVAVAKKPHAHNPTPTIYRVIWHVLNSIPTRLKERLTKNFGM